MKPIDCSEIIELNVGGCFYTTSRTTILSFPDSMLSHMINGQLPSATDSNKRIFIDRDGPLFRFILNFLRDKSLNLPENFSEYVQLRQEADFYRIEPIINQLDSQFFSKNNNLKCSTSPSLTSLDTLALNDNHTTKGIYFTLVSKLYQGTIISLIGCIRVLGLFTQLDTNSRRFLSFLLNQSSQNSTDANGSKASALNQPSNEWFICECKFMHEERLICCKPCGLNGPTDPKLVNQSQAIIKLAKKCGLSTSYWEDMFYLSMQSAFPNREFLSAFLNDKNNGKLMTSSVCDHRSSYDENNSSTLIERWYIPDIMTIKALIK